MKLCTYCNIEKPFSEFNVHKQIRGGYFKKCKDCQRIYNRDRLIELRKNEVWVEKERKRHRDKYRRDYKGPEKRRKRDRKTYEIMFPEKLMAKIASQRMPSTTKGLEKHHWSYNDEHFRDVIWLTKSQHTKAHRFIKYDQERKMYRRYDNNELLDTKERHAKFIGYCIINQPD